MVLDDSEFYEDSPPPGAASGQNMGNKSSGCLSLSQARAVVTSLNSLVFHTHLPRNPPQQQATPQMSAPQHQQRQQQQPQHPGLTVSAAAAGGGDAAAMLTDSAPLLLRSLYERDAR